VLQIKELNVQIAELDAARAQSLHDNDERHQRDMQGLKQ
jgi:hypothetical protein